MTIQEKKKKKGDRCVRIAKRKYDVWPSAYASGAVVKCRQGKIWKGLSEEELNEMIDEELEAAIEEEKRNLTLKKKKKADYMVGSLVKVEKEKVKVG